MPQAVEKYIDAEIKKSSNLAESNDLANAFRHLERAHILGQANTVDHTRIYWLMLKISWQRRDWREVFG